VIARLLAKARQALTTALVIVPAIGGRGFSRFGAQTTLILLEI